MSLNWREIDLVLNEIDLAGSHIQEIVQTDFRNINFRIYRPGEAFWLQICLETAQTRLHATTEKVRKPATRQRFAQLLHSRVKGGRITAASQINEDRIIRVDVATAGVESVIWIRLWGGASNLILTEPDGTVVDAFFRRPKRNEVSGGTFNPQDESQSPRPRKAHGDFESRFTSSPDDSVSLQIERHYQALADADERERLLSSIRRALVNRRDRLSSKLERARARLADTATAERLQLFGDLIMANLSQIPESGRWLETADYTNNDTPITIELQPDLTPVENAESYYSKAKKARRRAGALEEEVHNLSRRLGEAEHELESIDQKELEELRQLGRELTPDEKRKPRGGKETPGLAFVSDGFIILVGRNSRENDSLLRRHVRGNDLWLHTRDYPGGYVFVRAQKNKSVPLNVLLDAGNLAVHFSKARANGRAEVYYTQVKYLRRAKDGPAGLVLPTHEKNLSIVVEEERISRLRA